VPFGARGRLTDEYLGVVRETWRAEGGTAPAVWVGGHSPAAIRRAVRFGDAWHPLRLPVARMRAVLADNALPGFAPRIALRLTDAPVVPGAGNDRAEGAERPAGVGDLEQIVGDLEELRGLGAETVVLDPYHGDPALACRPEAMWRALTAVAERWRMAS
ncbi:LLM class F420-dependent oxidoreductase, partial [Streptomyces sp. UNOC14_S4]|nr:LLM class F420-dependent oxidoreductase [Streptomyces sp. UNOC14_S4]